MSSERLTKQMNFLAEIDKLKQIYRQNFITGGQRNETDAEHSWHMAMMAILLGEYVKDRSVNILQVLKMVLIHDIVEIDAGDTYCFDEKAGLDKAEREQRAAKRLFRLLPEDQAAEYNGLWEEFERQQTAEACFAAALDRLQPLLLHQLTAGKAWKQHGITSSKVYERNKHTREISTELGDLVQEMIESAIEKGYLAK
ncbi:MAG: HD domain-containing protein [Veillonellales bacterium]